MIVLSNSVAQVLAPGQSATFDIVVSHTGNAECFRKNSGAVRLRCRNAIYGVHCGSNIGSVEAGEAQIAICFDGSPLLETTMISQTATAGDLNNVSRDTSVNTCCCNGGAITVVNTGTTSINFGANSILRIGRIA